jgi:hypothetical protein
MIMSQAGGETNDFDELTMMKEPEEHQQQQSSSSSTNEVVEETEEDDSVQLFEGFSFALSYQVTEEEFMWKVEDLRKKIVENHGELHEQINDKVNIILVFSTNMVDTARISHAMKFNIPIVTEQYVHDCVSCNTRLDWNQYVVVTAMTSPLMQQSTLAHASAAAALQQHYNDLAVQQAAAVATNGGAITTKMNIPNANNNFSLKMSLKGSRQSVFTDQFPEVLYTLTWKHKYDVQIKASDKIFEGRSQSKILDSIEIALVLSQTNEIPVYDEDEKKRKRKRTKVDDDSASTQQGYSYLTPLQQQTTTTTGRGRGKKRNSSAKSNETVCVSSLHKGGDDEIVIRFGVNSTFCSKRFNYGAFKLYINYAPPDVSDDFHFTIYSAEFKTFVKKNANIAKYLHTPHQLNGSITVITKAMSQKIPVEYAKYMTCDATEAANARENAAASKKRPRKATTTTTTSNTTSNAKRKKEEEPDPYTVQQQQQQQQQQQEQLNQVALQQQMAMNPMMGMAAGYDMSGAMGLGYGAFGMNMLANPLAAQMMNGLALQQYGFMQSMEASMTDPSIAPEPVVEQTAESDVVNRMDEEKGLGWYGEPVGMNVNGDVFYYAFSHENEVYKINDCVFLAPETDKDEEESKNSNSSSSSSSEEWDKYWICKIINLVHSKTEGMKMVGQWFYRSTDLPDTSTPKLSNELFVSFDFNYNALDTIRGKCSVRHCTNPDSEEIQQWFEQNPHKHFFFRYGFNRIRSEVFELGEGVLRVLREKSNEGENTDEIDEEDEGAAMDEHEHLMLHQQFAFDQHYQDHANMVTDHNSHDK